MQVSEKSEELYDDLAKKIEAKDAAAARAVFQELVKKGLSRQEIVVRVSRLIEKRSAGKIRSAPMDKMGWLGPQLPTGPSVSDARKRPNPSERASIPNARHVDNRAKKSSPSPGISSDRFTLSVPERLAAKMQLHSEVQPAEANQLMPAEIKALPTISADGEAQEIAAAEEPGIMRAALETQRTVLTEAEAQRIVPAKGQAQQNLPTEATQRIEPAELEPQQTEPAKIEPEQAAAAESEAQEAAAAGVAVDDRPRPAQHGSPASFRRFRTIVTRTTAVTAGLAGLFVLWGLYGKDIEEVSVAHAQYALTWLQELSGRNFFTRLDSAKPAGRPAQPEQVSAVRENSDLPKSPDASAGLPPGDDSTPQATGTDSGPTTGGATAEAGTDKQATWTQARSDIPEKTPSRIEDANPQPPQQAISSATPPVSFLPNATEVVQDPKTADVQPPSVDTGALVAQGDQFLGKPDIASARLFYQRAAEAGDGRGALRMGMTFDPVFLARWRLRGIRSDRTQAMAWYRRASALGNAEAELMQNSLLRRTEVASHSTRGAATQNARPRAQRTSRSPSPVPERQTRNRGPTSGSTCPHFGRCLTQP